MPSRIQHNIIPRKATVTLLFSWKKKSLVPKDTREQFNYKVVCTSMSNKKTA